MFDCIYTRVYKRIKYLLNTYTEKYTEYIEWKASCKILIRQYAQKHALEKLQKYSYIYQEILGVC